MPGRPSESSSRLRPEAEPEELVRGWRMVDRARALFVKALPPAKLPDTWSDRRRTFSAVDYLSLLLIGLFNPSVRSLRGLCRASAAQRMQHDWRCGPLSLASLSDAQHLLDPELLRPVIEKLNKEVRAREASRERIADTAAARARMARFVMRAADSTVMEALPHMVWAAYGGGRPRADGRRSTAVRLHIRFDVESSSPAGFAVTPGKTCERRVWEQELQRETLPAETERAEREGEDDRCRIDIGDRYYGGNFALLERLARRGLHFLVRLQHAEHPEVIEELPVTEEDRAAGVVRQAWVYPGKSGRDHRGERTAVRIIWIEHPDKKVVLATDLPPEVLPAATAALMYRQRWQVEFFFRWIKCLLGCRHWLAESRRGVTLQLYLVLILGLLLQLECGQRPNRRMMEALHFYAQGLLTEEELAAMLQRAAAEAETARRSKRLYAKKMAGQKK